MSTTVLGKHKLTEAQLSGFIIAQMKNWFGKVASTWQFLRGYYLRHAQPQQFPEHWSRRNALYRFGLGCMYVAIIGIMRRFRERWGVGGERRKRW